MPIPPLRPNGMLPDGLHIATLQEVLAQFPACTPERQTLDAALAHGVAIIWQNHLAQRMIIDGSYVTDAVVSGDVDMAVLTPGLYQMAGEQQFMAMGIDTALIHIQFAHSDRDFDLWIDFFSHTRSGMAKGVIEIQEV